jgi:hypothetical protein
MYLNTRLRVLEEANVCEASESKPPRIRYLNADVLNKRPQNLSPLEYALL